MESSLEVKKRRRYQEFLAALRKLLQREKDSNLTTLQIKHEIGLLLLETKEQLKYGDIFEFLQAVAKDLNYSWGELYRCSRFAEKFPDFQTFIDSEFTVSAKGNETEPGQLLSPVTKPGADLTWHQVVNEPGILTPPKRPGEVDRQERHSECIFNSAECLGEVTQVSLCAVDLAAFETWKNERNEKPPTS